MNVTYEQGLNFTYDISLLTHWFYLQHKIGIELLN